MKSFLLCIGLSLTLFIAQPALAQDSTARPATDSVHPVRDSSLTDSMEKAGMDSIVEPAPSIKDSLHSERKNKVRPNADTATASRPKGATTDSFPDSPANSRDTSKIVDIFEEMKMAQQQQDHSIRKEQAAEKNNNKQQEPPHESNQQAAVSKIEADQNTQTGKIEVQSGSAPDTADSAASATYFATGAALPENKVTDSLFSAPEKDTIYTDKKDTIQSIFTLPTTAGPVTAVTPLTGRPVLSDGTNTDTTTTAAATIAADTALLRTEAQIKKDSLQNIAVAAEAAAEGKDSTSDTAQPNKNKSETIAVLPVRDSTGSVTESDSLALTKNTPFTTLFQPYRTFDKETEISSTTSLTILQQHVDYKTNADFTTQYQRTGHNERQFLFDVSVIRLNTQVETMGVQLKYDSKQNRDSTSTFAKPLFDIVGKKTYLKVDSTGKITEVDNTALGRQVNSVLSGLSLSGGDFEVGSNFGLLMSKSGAIQSGQQWSDSVRHGGNNRITTYTVQTILDGDMLVLISGTVSQSGVINSDGATFTTHFTGTQKGKMYVDQKTLLVKSRTITLDMKGTVDYNGQTLPASATSKIKEKVTAN